MPLDHLFEMGPKNVGAIRRFFDDSSAPAESFLSSTFSPSLFNGALLVDGMSFGKVGTEAIPPNAGVSGGVVRRGGTD